jgi:hypothetical protein
LNVSTTEDTRRLSSRETNPEYLNALERVAVLSDEIADRVRDNCGE